VAWLEATVGKGEWDAVLETLGEAPVRAAGVDAERLAEVRAEVHRALDDAVAGRLDPASTAERWSRSELALRLSCFERWLTDRAHRSLAPGDESREVRPGAHLPGAASLLNIRALFGLVDGVRELRSLLDTPLNKSLALEALLRRTTDLNGPRSASGQRRADQRQQQ
ncbi:MAG TPA: hypothetical protein VJ011_11005, partial [Steroidobacteraceae bacterium]|nr:hypothetical protein [Steroidobacteraceae bacterium]